MEMYGNYHERHTCNLMYYFIYIPDTLMGSSDVVNEPLEVSGSRMDSSEVKFMLTPSSVFTIRRQSTQETCCKLAPEAKK